LRNERLNLSKISKWTNSKIQKSRNKIIFNPFYLFYNIGNMGHEMGILEPQRKLLFGIKRSK